MTIDATAIIILVLSQFCKLQIAKFAKTKEEVRFAVQIATIYESAKIQNVLINAKYLLRNHPFLPHF